MIATLTALVLAAVLAVSGTAKLLDLRGSAATLRGFGIPSQLVPAAAVGLPLLELVIAAALVPVATGRVAAVAAAGLFCTFAIVIAASLLRGRRPDCGCFGRLHAAPIGWPTLARAAGLAAIASFIAVTGTGDGVSLLAGEPAAWLAALTGGQSILLVAVLRRHGRTLARLDALEAAPDEVQLAEGTPAPDFTLPDLAHEPVSLADLRATGRPTLLVFGHPGCGPCTGLLPELARWQQEHERRVTVALITQGDANLNGAQAEEHGLELVLLQQDREIAKAYGAQGTPAAVLVDADGLIDGSLQYGSDGVQALLAQALQGSPVAPRTLPAVASAAAAAILVAPSALAAPVDDEDDAIRELRRILRTHDPGLRREAQRIAAVTRRLIKAPRSAPVKFELVAAIALAKKEIRRTKDELEAVPVPDYRRGEKGARIAKSHATSWLAYLDLALDRYAKAARSSNIAELKRLDAEVVRFVFEAEKRRRLASRKLGCTRKLEDC